MFVRRFLWSVLTLSLLWSTSKFSARCWRAARTILGKDAFRRSCDRRSCKCHQHGDQCVGRTTRSNPQGIFVLPDLPAAFYSLQIEKQRFLRNRKAYGDFATYWQAKPLTIIHADTWRSIADRRCYSGIRATPDRKFFCSNDDRRETNLRTATQWAKLLHHQIDARNCAHRGGDRIRPAGQYRLVNGLRPTQSTLSSGQCYL